MVQVPFVTARHWGIPAADSGLGGGRIHASAASVIATMTTTRKPPAASPTGPSPARNLVRKRPS